MKAGCRALLAAAAVAGLLAVLSIQPQSARGFELGLYDGEFNASDGTVQTVAFDRAAQARARSVLVYVSWGAVAPRTLTPGFNPTNPADPEYDWTSTDKAVRDAAARGLKVLMAFVNAPPWAEGPDRPGYDKAPDGTWRPDPAAVGDFTTAIATRYSGNFMNLPAVRHWQLWAEPNLAVNLGPQFEGNTPVGFNVYRPMLNAFYASLKAVSPQNQVVVGGTAPYGGLTPARGLVFQRMQPLTFWRGLLCYRAGKQKKKKKGRKGAAAARKRRGKLIPLPCPNPARFDIAAHHPINVGAPTRAAINVNDVSTPDLHKLKRIISAAVRSGRALPGGGKPLWATEIWWNSNPPGRGLPLGRHARYLAQSFYILWKQGVQAVFWFQVRDLQGDPGGFPIPTTGLFLRNGTPKPAFQAFRFPFVTERLGKKRVRAWGMAPTPGPVQIQIGRKRFRNLRTLRAGGDRVFTGVLRLGGKARLRAQQGSEVSLVWTQS